MPLAARPHRSNAMISGRDHKRQKWGKGQQKREERQIQEVFFRDETIRAGGLLGEGMREKSV